MLKQLLCGATAAIMAISAFATNPVTEFRGAWMHTVFQGQYKQKGTEELQKYLISQLDSLQDAGVNAVLFQVRPSADAFYPSKLEPWSRFLTDNGAAPVPYWDPLQFMIDESHKRGMELHAWLNPYRVTTSKGEKLAPSHLYNREPQRFVSYADNKMYFDPGLPENREFIEDVVMDIVNRYDVDGIHFDDYFYPYPVAGADFPDDASYAKYGKGMDRGDWRRQNVDLLIEGIHNKIASSQKPWVRFGISPFGIYRNKSTWAGGSDTNGLQNYDALYADVLLWARKGWIDYLLPQLYWELEHKKASTAVLADWWNDNAEGRHMYFGQDVHNIMKHKDVAPSTDATQLRHKIEISRRLPNVQGNCWWPGYAVTANFGGVADSLATDLQSTIALVPAYPWMSENKPAAVTVAPMKADSKFMRWVAPKAENPIDEAAKYVIYRFDTTNKNINFDDPANIEAVVYDTKYELVRPGIYFVRTQSHANQLGMPSNGVIYQ